LWSSVQRRSQVGQEIRERTPLCSPCAEEGCAHFGAVVGRRERTFCSAARRYRRCAPSGRRRSRRRLLTSYRCGVKRMSPPLAREHMNPRSCTSRKRETWPPKQWCGSASILFSALPHLLPPPPPPLVTGARIHYPAPKTAQYSAVPTTQAGPYERTGHRTRLVRCNMGPFCGYCATWQKRGCSVWLTCQGKYQCCTSVLPDGRGRGLPRRVVAGPRYLTTSCTFPPLFPPPLTRRTYASICHHGSS